VAVDSAYYCSKICGGKCCYVYNEVGKAYCRCPQLTKENTCSIYKERYEQGQEFKTTIMANDGNGLTVVNFSCGFIKQILASGKLPEEIANQCCYNKPELLEGYDYD
jgi:hypothetical protein